MKKISKSGLLICFFSLSLCLLTAQNKNSASSKSAVALYEEGIAYQNEENYWTASQNVLEAVRVNPNYTDAWFSLSQCSYYLGEYDLALQYLANAEKIEKNNSRIQNLKGMIYLETGDTETAKNIFQNILKIYPNDVEAHFGLAELELYNGKFSGAEAQYEESLARQNNNKKALLSLALLYASNGNFTKAQNYVRRAMNYYSGDANVHYLSSIIYCMEGNLQEAEKQARIAVEINGNYTSAYELLSSILYYRGDYQSSIDLCDYLISHNRNSGKTWYLKGLNQKKLGDTVSAIKTWDMGLTVSPNDELMRMALELDVRETLSLEDPRRKTWAQYHLNNADQAYERYDGATASYEYQRTLMIDPTNSRARLSYAKMLELNGMHETYLDQLKFTRENSDFTTSLSKKEQNDLIDTVEAYDSILTDTLAQKWNIDTFFLDKIRWNIGIYYTDTYMSFGHADENRLTAMAASDIFSGVAFTSVRTETTPVSGYGEAFSKARKAGFDYFIILSLNEAEEDMTLSAAMYSARTGTETKNMHFYATGNGQYSIILRRLRESILSSLPVRGKIITRKTKNVVIDLGKTEHMVEGAVFDIVKKGKILTADTGTGVYYKTDDILGQIRITKAGEEISEGIIENKGFYDRINENDEIVLISMPKSENEDAVDTAPTADARGNNVIEQSVVTNNKTFVEEIRKAVEKPAILELIKSIR